MTLEQIIVLDTIVSTGSFRNASLNLHKAQSAISYAIKKLEAEFEVQIFDRSDYRPRLTPAGKAIHNKGKEILGQLKQLQELGQSLKNGCEPTLKLAVSALYPMARLIPALKRNKKLFPQVELILSIDLLSSDRLLLDDKVDLAITEVRGNESLIDSFGFDEVQMIAVAGHRVDPKNYLNSADLPQVIVRSSEPGSERISGVHNLTHHWRVTDFQTKRLLLLENMGWGYMPEHLVSEDIKKNRLQVLIKKKHKVPIYISNRHTKTLGPATMSLKDQLLNEGT